MLKKYRTIVVDPPWKSGSGGKPRPRSNGLLREVFKMPYKQLSLEQIAALPVAGLAAENCELYLWTTQRYLPHAFGVLEAWGFRYRQTLVWCKPPAGTGRAGLYCPTNEFLLLGRRGKMPAGKTRKDSTWWTVKRTPRHSKKPEFFQDLIEDQSDGPRVELFARRPREGWDVWGYEVDSSVDTPGWENPNKCPG